MTEIQQASEYLRHWMQQIMQEHEWNAREWAVKAGTSPTNITRFLRGSDHIPSYATLVKLAAAAGAPIPTPGFIQKSRVAVRIPLLNSGSLHTIRGRLSAGPTIAVEWEGENAFALRLDTGEYSKFGYRPGDIIVVDPDVKTKSGDHVLAYHEGKTSIWLFKEPYYCSTKMLGKRVKLDNNAVIGVVVELIRRITKE